MDRVENEELPRRAGIKMKGIGKHSVVLPCLRRVECMGSCYVSLTSDDIDSKLGAAA